jgi:hypothetical protein
MALINYGTVRPLLAAWALIALTAAGGSAAGDIAPKAGVSASSAGDVDPKENAIDGKMARDLETPMNAPAIEVAGDLLGHLIGTVSRVDGTIAVKDAAVEVTGRTPAGPWQSGAKTDAQGFFRADLPLSSVGPVKISARAGEMIAETTLDSGDIAKRLTPRPAKGSADRLSLDGQWDFVADPPKDFAAKAQSLPWHAIAVPAHWEMEGFVCESGFGLYQRTFTVPRGWAGKRIKFRAEAIYSHCEVFVNGVRVGSHEGGATPFELDITGAAHPGKNQLMILVEALSRAASLDRMSYFAYFNLAGLWRPLEVFAVEPAHISRLALATTFDPAHKNAVLSVDVDVANEQSKALPEAGVKLRLFDPRGQEAVLRGLSTNVSLSPWETRAIRLQAKVTAPDQWNAEKAKLYTLVAELTGRGAAAPAIRERFGFRQVEVKGRLFEINGKPVKFRGVSRLDAHPLTGRYLSDAVNKKDIEMMKRANFNALRNCVFPSHPYTMELTDELGLYVEDDGPFCFVWDAAPSQDLRNAPFIVGVMSECVERDRNRPSVVIWSICNESQFGRDFEMAHQFMRQSDPSRPCGTGQSANLEIATYHCPMSFQRLADTKNLPMPVINDEAFGIFHGWGAMAYGLELDPGLRDYWGTHIQELLEAARRRDNYIGTMQFSWVDDSFLLPNKGLRYWRDFNQRIHFVDRVYKMPRRGIVGDYVWGTVDGWRRPRPEWWLAKKLNSPIRIQEAPLALPPEGGPIEVPVENLNFWTDLNDYTCQWRLERASGPLSGRAGDSPRGTGNAETAEKGQVRARVAPQARGSVSIQTQRLPKAADTLVLEFFDPSGRMIDGYKLGFSPRQIPALPNSGRPARIVEMPARAYLQSADAIRLLGRNTELSYDKSTGQMLWCLAGRETVIIAGPVLHVMRFPGDAEPYPDPRSWVFSGADSNQEQGQAVLHWNGRYGDFAGGFDIKMDDAGDVQMAYRFKYTGEREFSAREIGLGFEVPSGMGRLEWDRKADWSYYPDDHIGRPRGVAMVHSTWPQTIPPGDRPYSQDDHPWGCNDFRSTKRHICHASLTNPQGAGIRVISDGGQSLRATMGPDTLGVNVMDYFDGSPAEINEYVGVYGTGQPIKPGDVLQGVVKLQLLPPTQGGE